MPTNRPTRPKRQGRGRPKNTSEDRQRRSQPTMARLLAVRVLDRVHRARAYADLSLHHYLAHSGLAAIDRALATELVYGTLRWRGRLDYLLDQLLDQPLAKLEPPVASTLRVGAYQLLFSDRIPDSAAVDESVRCIRALGAERATGLVNAVLRRLAREHATLQLPSLEDDPKGHLTHALSLPPWIAEQWLETYGPEQAARLAEASNRPPPIVIRTNRLRTSRSVLLEELQQRFPQAAACEFSQDGILLGKGDPGRDPAFVAGHFTVQDEAAQLAVEILDPKPGEVILDACAAPGGKTTAIAERMDGRGGVLALDRHAGRLRLVARATRRLGIENVHVLERDAGRSLTDLPTEWLGPLELNRPELGGEQGEEHGSPQLFDRVLVDAPCSGLGTLRRNPDARWHIRQNAVPELARLQLAILEQTAAVLRPGGVLTYSTCTLAKQENEEVVMEFLKRNKSFAICPADATPPSLASLRGDDGFFRTFPHLHNMDGFFVARLERSQ